MKKHLFIIDTLSDIKVDNDSSTLLIRAGLKRDYEIFIATLQDLVLDSKGLNVNCKKVLDVDFIDGYKFDKVVRKFADDFNVIWLRKNPPVNETYLIHLELFNTVSREKIFFVNDPFSIKNFSEKLTIFEFPELITNTIVTSNLKEIYNFWKKFKKIVVKSLTGFGGDSVILMENWKRDEQRLIALSNNGQRFLMVQRFIENVYKGDKRVTIVDGKIINALLRVPREGSFLAATREGAKVEMTKLTEREKLISQKVARFLKRNNIFWAGIDLIDGNLSEINLTSPSILPQANIQMGLKLEEKILDILGSRL